MLVVARHVDGGLHDIVGTGASGLELAEQVRDDPLGLGIDVAGTDELAVLVDRDGARREHERRSRGDRDVRVAGRRCEPLDVSAFDGHGRQPTEGSSLQGCAPGPPSNVHRRGAG
jgi:hypothetical protein